MTARSRSEPPKVPTWLPCGCMAMGTRLKINRDSLTLVAGEKVCRHGTAWKLAWVQDGEIRHGRGRPGNNRKTGP